MTTFEEIERLGINKIPEENDDKTTEKPEVVKDPKKENAEKNKEEI